MRMDGWLSWIGRLRYWGRIRGDILASSVLLDSVTHAAFAGIIVQYIDKWC